jgi:hypothetical protein
MTPAVRADRDVLAVFAARVDVQHRLDWLHDEFCGRVGMVMRLSLKKGQRGRGDIT